MSQNNPLKELIENIWEQYDTDKSGTIEGNEIKLFIADICKGKDLEGKEEELQTYFDPDGNGKISKAEVYAFFAGD